MASTPELDGLAPLPSAGVDNSLAWALAGLPIAWALIDLVLLMVHVAVPAQQELLIASTVGFSFVVQDARRLRARGLPVHWAWGLLMFPAYLVHRARRTSQSYALPLASIVLLLASVAITVATDSKLGQVTLDMNKIQTGITKQVDQQTGTTVSVHCPDKTTYWVHDRFRCTVSADGDSLVEVVTIHTIDGTVTWQPTQQG